MGVHNLSLFCVMMAFLVFGMQNYVESSNLVFISDAVAKGAVCLDGSPGAYSFEAGYGAGSNSWILYLYGGGFCTSTKDCLYRATKNLGSTSTFNTTLPINASGIMQSDPSNNPDFYNWNHVGLWYCDGGLYSGDVEEVDPSTNLHFRGARIFSAVVEELLEKGMGDADHAILTGCSAGGLGTMVNCNKFRSMVPLSTNVKCVADAGYFVNIKNISGYPFVEMYLDSVVNTNGILKNLDPTCREEMRRMNKKESLCIFPENLAPHIKTPIFFVNAQYDFVQINAFLVSVHSPPGTWNSCRYDITQCNNEQLLRIQAFKIDFLNAFYKGAGISPSRGYFINGCFDHCQTDTQERWLREDSPRIKGISIAKAVGDWYFERKPSKEIGISYPLDHTCHNYKGV